jgi:hypothetical protein
MSRVLVSIILALTVIAAGCGATQPTSTSAPAAPEDVLSIWHSPSSPQGYPLAMAGEVHLGKSGSPDSALETDSLSVQNRQWLDIVVKSRNIRLFFYLGEPGAVRFEVVQRHSEYSQDKPTLESLVNPRFNPTTGRILYGQPVLQETEMGEDTIYSVAIRLFAEGLRDSTDVSSKYIIRFINSNVTEEADISYEVYKLNTTPDWGYTYYDDILAPWMMQQLGGAYSESKWEQLYEEWYEQFK